MKGEKKAVTCESRRGFTKAAVAAAALGAPAILAATADSQTPARPPEPASPPNPQPTPQTQPPSPVAAGYAEVARALYGDRLTPEEFERVRRDLEGNVRAAERLRSAKLDNADEPDFVFGA